MKLTLFGLALMFGAYFIPSEVLSEITGATGFAALFAAACRSI